MFHLASTAWRYCTSRASFFDVTNRVFNLKAVLFGPPPVISATDTFALDEKTFRTAKKRLIAPQNGTLLRY